MITRFLLQLLKLLSTIVLKACKSRPVIETIYTPKDANGKNVIWPGMALGIKVKNATANIEMNSIELRLQVKDDWLLIKDLRGGATAPKSSVLTGSVPAWDEIKEWCGRIDNKLKDEENAINNIGICVCAKLSSTIELRSTEEFLVNILRIPEKPIISSVSSEFVKMNTNICTSGKTISVAGKGFMSDPNRNKVFFSNAQATRETVPSIARGDALLGVKVPYDLPPGEYCVTVQILDENLVWHESNNMEQKVIVSSPIKIVESDWYMRPGEIFKLKVNTDITTDVDRIWLLLLPYHSEKPVLVKAIRRVSGSEIEFQIPKKGLESGGAFDARLLVDRNFSENEIVIDIHKRTRIVERVRNQINKVHHYE